MKKYFIALGLLIIVLPGISQQIPAQENVPELNSYLQKNKTQKNTGWVLLISGLTLKLAGIAMLPNDSSRDWGSDSGKSQENTAAAFFIAGTTCSITSIPFFIAASVNKRKGMGGSVSLKMKTWQSPDKSGFISKPIPELSLRIGL